MKKIYRISKIYTHLIMPLLLLVISALCFLAVRKYLVSFELRNIIFPVFLSIVIYHLLKTAFKIEVEEEKIIFSTLLGKKVMNLEEIKSAENGFFSLKVKSCGTSVYILQLTESFTEISDLLVGKK